MASDAREKLTKLTHVSFRENAMIELSSNMRNSRKSPAINKNVTLTRKQGKL